MALILGGARSKSMQRQRKKGTGSPSIREVCLVGVETPAPAAGARLTWSGRTYRVEATQLHAHVETGEALRYVHLSALAEG
jgi:hypothetical protein